MRRDPLAILQRVRDAAVVEATRELAGGLQREQTGRQRLVEHNETMRREQAEADTADAVDFAAWLPRARVIAGGNARSLAAEEERVGRLRQALLAKRTEAAAVKKAIERRQAAVSLARSRREQAAMDEAAGRRRLGR
jgi:flagellar biosynthesis chaperone FliJ